MTAMTHIPTTSVLSQPLRLPCGLTLPNRIMKAAMAESLADQSSAPSEALVDLYHRWAGGGAGALITGMIGVARGINEAHAVVVDEESDPAKLAAWARAVHWRDARLLGQIAHPGRQAPVTVTRHPVAPSALPPVRRSHAFGPSRALTAEEILELVERFGNTAALLETAGFDGVEVHAAHGYLVGQFLSPATNRRTDEWGGDLDGRARFLLEIVRRIRQRVGSGFAVAVKINASDFRPGGFDIDDSAHVVGRLGGEGVDLIEISGGTLESRSSCLSVRADDEGTDPDAYFAGFAPRLRAMTDVPLALTGGLRSRHVMEQLLADRVVDIIGLGRPLVEMPDCPQRLLDGEMERLELVGPPNPGGMGELLWYTAQFRLLAQGKEFNPEYARWHLAFDLLRAAAEQPAATMRNKWAALLHRPVR